MRLYRLRTVLIKSLRICQAQDGLQTAGIYGLPASADSCRCIDHLHLCWSDWKEWEIDYAVVRHSVARYVNHLDVLDDTRSPSGNSRYCKGTSSGEEDRNNMPTKV